MTYREAITHHPEADSFHFAGALQSVRQALKVYKWVVLASMVVTTALVAAYIWIWPATYEAEVMVAVDSDKDVQRTAFYQGWNIFRKEALNDEAALMTSPPVLREVVRRLDLQYEDVYHPFTRYAIHLWGESWVGRNYRAVKRWILGGNPPLLSPAEIKRLQMLNDMRAGISLRQVGEANIGLLVVRGPNERVAEIANTLVTVYLEQRRERHVAEATQAHRSLSTEAAKTQAELDEVGQRIRAFRAETGTALLFEKDRGQINQWLALRGSITDLRAVIQENEASVKVLNNQIASEAENLKSDRMYKEDANKERLPKLELALAAARQSYQPDSREVRDLEDQIKVAQTSIRGSAPNVVVRNSARVSDNYEVLRAKKHSLESSLAGARSALKVREAEMERMSTMISRIPHSMQVNHELERLQGHLESKYAGINSKLVIAAVSMATALSAPPAMRVIEPATVPEQASAPKTKLLLAAAVMGGALLGLILALLLDLVNQRVTRARLSAQGSPVQLLGVVGQGERLLDSLFPRPLRIPHSSAPRIAGQG